MASAVRAPNRQALRGRRRRNSNAVAISTAAAPRPITSTTLEPPALPAGGPGAPLIGCPAAAPSLATPEIAALARSVLVTPAGLGNAIAAPWIARSTP